MSAAKQLHADERNKTNLHKLAHKRGIPLYHNFRTEIGEYILRWYYHLLSLFYHSPSNRGAVKPMAHYRERILKRVESDLNYRLSDYVNRLE